MTDNVVTNLQLQIDQLKTADHVFITNAIANDIGVPVGSSVEYTLKFLDDQNTALVEAIKNSSNFVKTADYTTPGTHRHTVNGTKAFALILGGGGGGSGGSDSGRNYWGGGGGGGGKIAFSGIISTTRGSSYNIVVGAGGIAGPAGAPGTSTGQNVKYGGTGGTSSAFGTTAEGGTGGGSNGNGGTGGAEGGSTSYMATQERATGKNGSSTSSQGYTLYVAGGGAGGHGCGSVSSPTYGDDGYPGGSYGGGRGGKGCSAISGTNTTVGEDGRAASGYGCGGGGGGGNGSYGSGDDYTYIRGGIGGPGKNGRVIIYEAGAFSIG